MKAETAWQQVKLPRYAKLSKKGRFDIVVIGGGITGLTAAYLLQQSGKNVCLLERDRQGQGDTAWTTAHLTAVTDLRISKLVSRFGEGATNTAWNGGAAAINQIEQIADTERIDCEFRRVPGDGRPDYRLEKIFKQLDITYGRVEKCKGMEGLIEEGESEMEKGLEPRVLDAALICAAQRVEHYEIAWLRPHFCGVLRT